MNWSKIRAYLTDEKRRPFLLGTFFGIGLAACCFGILAMTRPHEAAYQQEPVEGGGYTPAPSVVSVLADRTQDAPETPKAVSETPVAARPIAAGTGGQRAQPRIAAQGSPIPLPNVPNLPAPARAQPQPAPVQASTPAPVPAPKAGDKAASQDAGSAWDHGETFADGRISYFGGEEIPLK